jgi:hypothetical protein
MFPYMPEGTLAGLAAGYGTRCGHLACGCWATSTSDIEVNGAVVDLA